MFGIQALSVHGDELDLFAKMKDETHTFGEVLDIGQFALSKPRVTLLLTIQTIPIMIHFLVCINFYIVAAPFFMILAK